MAVNKANKTGKWSETATWGLGHVPTAAEDAEILTGITVKLEATGKCRSLKIAGTGILEGNSKLEIGNSEKPENPSGAAFEIASGERIKGSVELKFLSTFATSAMKVSGFTSGSTGAIVFENKNAKYELTGNVVAASSVLEIGASVGATAELNTKTHSVECARIAVNEKASATFETSTVTCTVASGNNATIFGTETTVSAASATFKIQKANVTCEGHTLGTVEMEGENQEVKPSGTTTIETLVLTKAGKSTKFLKSSTLKLGNLEAPGSKTGELTKIESSEAGKPYTFEFSKAVTVKNLVVKDSHATAAHEPTDEFEGTEATFNVSGNEHWKFVEVATGIKGKATGELLLTGSATGTARNVVSGKATGTLLLTGTGKGTAANVVTGKATGTLLLTGTATATLRAVVSGSATGALLLTGTSSGRLGISTKAAGALLLTGTANGTTAAVVSGKATGTLLLTGAGMATLRAVVSGKAAGTLLLTGKGTGTLAGTIFGKATGALILNGTAAATLRAVVSGKASGPMVLTGTSTGRRAQVVAGSATGTVRFTGKGAVFNSLTGKASGVLLLTGAAHPRIGGTSAGLVAIVEPSSKGAISHASESGVAVVEPVPGRLVLV